VRIEGGLDAQTIRLESDAGSRAVRGGDVIVRDTGVEQIGVCIRRSFVGRVAGAQACFAERGAAVDAGKLAGLSRPAIDLATLNGRCRNPGMQVLQR